MFTRIVKPVKFLPNFIWKLNYDFQFEGGTLQYDVGCLLDEVLSQGKQRNSMLEDGDASVSYTHLTLPTIYSV